MEERRVTRGKGRGKWISRKGEKDEKMDKDIKGKWKKEIRERKMEEREVKEINEKEKNIKNESRKRQGNEKIYND